MMGASPHIDDDRQARSASLVIAHAADDAAYEAALAALLDQVAHRPGLLDRIWLALKRFHARRRAEAERLPVEYWFWTE
jgi:hypothetical protein